MSDTIDPAAGETDSLAIENAIFETALQIGNKAQRREFLERTYQGDSSALEEMEGLLGMAGTSSAFFLEGHLHTSDLAKEIIDELPDKRDELEPVQRDEREGARIGRYQLIRKIGEGGGGEIFEAVQEGMVRPVALKIIRSGMDSESVVSRFETERQTLEIMEHPNIARMLDAGKTSSGRPFFVMELVRGARITTFCETDRLDIRGRLELFLLVCRAIQHAHQKGIVHRDIKPSNVLVEKVDGSFVAKVIDFGIAKAMQGNPYGSGEITRVDQIIGTPAYMSPEQIDMGGMDIDTRADIYSLGALLYELLAGCPPFDTEDLLKRGVTEMRRILIEENPPLLSAAARRFSEDFKHTSEATDREKWAGSLRGDLDWIVFKAMEKDRNRRYHTVNSLSMDVRRYLRNEPVIARKPSRGYSLRKFVQRNRTACGLGIAMLLSLVAGLGTTTVLYFREKDALAEQARLKQQAQARANVSRAAILLSEGDREEADFLLRQNPLESIEASPEAAEVFRSLGRWNAVFGRWDQAANCFRLMNEANRLGDRDRIVEGLDLLMTAPTYLEAGDRGSYIQFRDDVIDRYLPARNALQAEHLLKVCLLLPVGESALVKLESTAEVCRSPLSVKGRHKGFPEWNALSLSLYEYRRGDYEEAIRQAEICLGFEDRAGSRAAAARCVLAMSRFEMGDVEGAETSLRKAVAEIEFVESQISDSGFPPIGNWFAWALNRVLAKEAVALIGE